MSLNSTGAKKTKHCKDFTTRTFYIFWGNGSPIKLCRGIIVQKEVDMGKNQESGDQTPQKEKTNDQQGHTGTNSSHHAPARIDPASRPGPFIGYYGRHHRKCGDCRPT